MIATAYTKIFESIVIINHYAIVRPPRWAVQLTVRHTHKLHENAMRSCARDGQREPFYNRIRMENIAVTKPKKKKKTKFIRHSPYTTMRETDIIRD